MKKTIDHKGAPLSYSDIGKGPAVMLVHGFAEDGRIWHSIASTLESEYRVIVPDLPGSGDSGLSTELSIESMAEALYDIVIVEKIKEIAIIGHSMGGYVMLSFAEKFPPATKAFCLFHSTAYEDTEEKKNARRKNIKFIEAHGSHEFLKQSTPGLFSDNFKLEHRNIVDELIQRYRGFNPLSLIKYYEAMIRRSDRSLVLKTSVCPVAFIIGRHDQAVPFQDSLELCHLPSLSYIHILERSGHMGMLEEPENSQLILKNFLKDVFVNQETSVTVDE